MSCQNVKICPVNIKFLFSFFFSFSFLFPDFDILSGRVIKKKFDMLSNYYNTTIFLSRTKFLKGQSWKIYKWMASELQGELRKIYSATLTGEPKSSLTKYSVEFNDFSKPQRPHRRLYFRLIIVRPYTLLCVKRSAGA